MLSHTCSSESQRSANPDTPPPEYSVLVPTQQAPSSSQPSQYPFDYSGSQFASPPFGPTPLVQSPPTLGSLPYYDPRSSYSVEAAMLRAKWRFIGAGLWATGLIACLFLLGALRKLHTVWT